MLLIQRYQNNIAGLLNALSNLERQASDEIKKEFEKTRQIHQIQLSINKNTPPSTLKNKIQQIEYLSNELVRIQNKKADISKKIANCTTQLFGNRQELAKEEEKERNKIEQFERRRRQEQLNYQRMLTRELSEQTNITPRVLPQSSFSSNATQKPLSYDAFICHASEDKKEFVEPLAQAFQHLGFNIWYDNFQLKVGDSLRRSIDHGLASSRYGIVVLSSAFFAKNWPQYELDGLVAREMNSGTKIVLPVWHKVSKDEVMSYSPSMADKLALKSSALSIKEIAEELAKVLQR